MVDSFFYCANGHYSQHAIVACGSEEKKCQVCSGQLLFEIEVDDHEGTIFFRLMDGLRESSGYWSSKSVNIGSGHSSLTMYDEPEGCRVVPYGLGDPSKYEFQYSDWKDSPVMEVAIRDEGVVIGIDRPDGSAEPKYDRGILEVGRRVSYVIAADPEAAVRGLGHVAIAGEKLITRLNAKHCAWLLENISEYNMEALAKISATNSLE